MLDVMAGSNWSWMIQAIMSQRENLNQIQQIWDKMIGRHRLSMKHVYDSLVDYLSRVSWRFLMYHNLAKHRVMFTFWMMCMVNFPPNIDSADLV